MCKKSVLCKERRKRNVYKCTEINILRPAGISRRRNTEKTRYLDLEVPHRARHRHQLGRHRKDLTSDVLQRAACCPRGIPGSAHRGTAQPQGQLREKSEDHPQIVQCLLAEK